jgi:ABC-2 type transport system ATP-binding protein
MLEPDSTETSRPAPVVEVHGLVKIFRDFWRRPRVNAVDGIDLRVEQGEIFGLLGPNGSGKSTTIKLLLGLLFPTRGSIQVMGASPTRVETKRHLGYLPETSDLYPYLTPRETLNFFGGLFGLGRSELRERTDQLLEMVGLEHVADRQVGEFSQGMKRRIGLAQALINDPQLLILDEPTAGLDPPACRQIKDLLFTLVSRGKSIILSSHLLADVEDVCNRLAILYNGKIRAQGSVKELLKVHDQVNLTIPALAPDEMTRVLKLLRDALGQEPDITHPSIDLERFFLDVISSAEGETPSGATRPRGVARYLDGGT